MELAEIPVRELLPHDPPMVLLDRVVSFEEATLSAEVDISAPAIGYLLGTRAYKSSVPMFPIGETLQVHVESLFVEMGLGAFACHIDMGETVATAKINVYQPEGDVAEGLDAGRISR
jgi:predicted hotdog family 3-hydroxylacyl-ACP dehydratase